MSMGQEQTFRFLLTEKVCFFSYFISQHPLLCTRCIDLPTIHPNRLPEETAALFFLGATFILGLIPLVRHIAVRSRLDGVEI